MKKMRKLQLAALLVGVSATIAGFAVAGDSVQTQANETPTFAMEEGAAVRTKSDDSGIRWITNVNQAWYNNQEVPAGATVQFGTFVTSANNVSSIDELDEDFTNEKTDLPCTATADFTDGTFTYYSAITFGNVATDKKAASYATELVARSYMKYSTDGENWTYTYADSNDNQRCIRAVALEAIEDTGEFSKLDGDEQTAVKGYVGTAESQVNMAGEDEYCETAVEKISSDYAVAYQGAKKVGTFTAGTLTLDRDFAYNQDVVLTLFDAEGNYAKAGECKYVTRAIAGDLEFAETFNVRSVTIDGYYVLTTDVDMGDTLYGGATFNGVLDGQGKSISGISVNVASNYAGLFLYFNGTMKNVKIYGAMSNTKAHALISYHAASAGDVTLENVYVEYTAVGAGNSGAIFRQVYATHSLTMKNVVTVGLNDTQPANIGSMISYFTPLKTFNVTMENCYAITKSTNPKPLANVNNTSIITGLNKFTETFGEGESTTIGTGTMKTTYTLQDYTSNDSTVVFHGKGSVTTYAGANAYVDFQNEVKNNTVEVGKFLESVVNP